MPTNRSAFLWGPRKTGKTYWINKNYADSAIIDLLKTDVFADYASRPSLLRERYQEYRKLVVIDEIQMVPDLLNEIHWLIENASVSFLMIPNLPYRRFPWFFSNTRQTLEPHAAELSSKRAAPKAH